MTHLLLLLALHHRPSKKAVLEFTHYATTTLASYEDGSGQAWLEAEEIKGIALEIDALIKHPRAKDVLKREHQIQIDIDELSARDIRLQRQSIDIQREAIPI